MLARIFNLACSISPSVRRVLMRTLYQGLSVLDEEGRMIFMNFGYADLDTDVAEIELKDIDEMNRYCIQLYHHVAGAIELKGLDVLEVGCGRGGGASYIMRYLKPESMTGVDIAEKAIAFCNQYHAVEELSFVRGDAESLPFDDNTFDVIVNVESSHCYGSLQRFLSEVYRALRPGGYFLFADYRDRSGIDALREQLVNCGFECLKEEKISLNVYKALELDNRRKMSIIRQRVPWLLQRPFQAFAGMQGTEMYEKFRTGAFDYRSFILSKRK